MLHARPEQRGDRDPTGPRYQVGPCLAHGGMAEVLHGTVLGAEGFTRDVAIKRVLPGFSTMPHFAAMFVDEARLASQLVHPNIVQVFDFDRDAQGRHFLVMELVDGLGLDALRDSGPLSPSMINFIMTEALRGLGYAHDLPVSKHGVRGIVHRDVSPHNVLLSWHGAVKLADFGIAKAREATSATASTVIKGKAGYMSPEQANGEPLDGRSDLFAVGVMMWELLSGQPLFRGTTQESIAQLFFRPIPRPSELRAGVPEDLEAVTMRLLARDRNARYATAEHAIADLASCRDVARDGRGELVRLLAERFPGAKEAAFKRPARSNRTRAGSLPSGSAAAQSVARSRVPYLVAGAALVAAIAVGNIVGKRDARERTLGSESLPRSESAAPSLFQITIQIAPEAAPRAVTTLLQEGRSAARHP